MSAENSAEAKAILGQQPKTAILVGASSGIGRELAKQLAKRGYILALVARRKNLLEELAEELNLGEKEPRAYVFQHDVKNFDEVPQLFEKITAQLRGLDLIVYNAGIMPDIGPEEYDFKKYREIVEVNFLGAMAWLNLAAERFLKTEHGTIVGISSVAGDRGRRKNPPYAASKAALTTYLESLRNRLSTKGVKVLTIKPGPVKTPMTAHLKDLPIPIEASKAAYKIAEAIEKKDGEIYVPGIWRLIMAIIRNIPSFIFRRMSI